MPRLTIQEDDVSHGVIDVFAFQEALLLEAVFGVVILTMIWIGFRRWLQHRERMGRLMAEQTAERVERVETRLNAIEQIVTEGGTQMVPQIDAPAATPPPAPSLKRDEA